MKPVASDMTLATGFFHCGSYCACAWILLPLTFAELDSGRLRYLGFMGLEPEAERQRGWGEKELAFNPALW